MRHKIFVKCNYTCSYCNQYSTVSYICQDLGVIISKIHKYLDLQELTPSILNDMVKRVYVHAPQIIDGKRTQQIDICYELIGILPMSLLKENSETT